MAERARGGRARRPTRAAEPPRPRILVVDDDAAVRELLVEALGLRQYAVTAVASVQEAEEVRQRVGPEAIALVIADVRLTPTGQEGYELYQRWKAAHPTMRFLLMSGDPHSRTLPDVATGAVPFLSKPFTIQELLDRVRDLIGP
ncbi:MAG: hypothetical protein KatS3mg131_3162 [Candidatus Tectimicrobiota bacterium]|nr:MAG: hypothetical protein KatS3mg131_3162 [Candidatus Tectomicrobia bacterium]